VETGVSGWGTSKTTEPASSRGRAIEHDPLLTRKDGSVRIYDRPIPKAGDIVKLPIDGRTIKASVQRSPEGRETEILVDVEAVEI
jgi:hypothetical protein